MGLCDEMDIKWESYITNLYNVGVSIGDGADYLQWEGPTKNGIPTAKIFITISQFQINHSASTSALGLYGDRRFLRNYFALGGWLSIVGSSIGITCRVEVIKGEASIQCADYSRRESTISSRDAHLLGRCGQG